MTPLSPPVLNDRLVQSANHPQALKPREIESPIEAMEPGGGVAAAALGVADPRMAMEIRAARAADPRQVTDMAAPSIDEALWNGTDG
ncbi:hypothetical protein GCM10022255_049950 [Dactylosporangium darangshiense]|uniref:Uncharacterized protein n=1 Tax=Dactylosporangium darangshiense TaxID=579108 RepID=A0ABP8DCE4_9ACTN